MSALVVLRWTSTEAAAGKGVFQCIDHQFRDYEAKTDRNIRLGDAIIRVDEQ